MTFGRRILMLGEDTMMVTLEGPEQGLFQELSRLLRQEGKEMVKRLTSVGIYIWLGYICFRFAVLVRSSWQPFKDLIKLIKKYTRVGSDEGIPTSRVGLPVLILQRSPVSAT